MDDDLIQEIERLTELADERGVSLICITYVVDPILPTMLSSVHINNCASESLAEGCDAIREFGELMSDVEPENTTRSFIA